MANSKHAGKKKGKRNSPADVRRRAAVAEVVTVGARVIPNYTPRRPALKSVQYPQVSASVLLVTPVTGIFEVKEISGLRVEVFPNRNDDPVLRVLYMPEGNSFRDVWRKSPDTFLPLKFVEVPNFVSKIPVESMREVQQVIYNLLRPYWMPPMVVRSFPSRQEEIIPETPSPASSKVGDFFHGKPGRYAFPAKGPKATFQVEDLAGAIGYRLVGVEEGNPLRGVRVPLVLSRKQLLGEAKIATLTRNRGGEKVRETLMQFFAGFGFLK